MPSGIVTLPMIKRGGPSLVSAINNQSYLQHPWQKVRYVQSTHTRAVDANNSGENADAPLKTIARANTVAVAGDMILVGPGHVETVSSAAGLVISKHDLTIIGCGIDQNVPKIEVGTVVGAYMEITGNRVQMHNFLIAPVLDAVTKLCLLTGVAPVLNNWRIDESSSFQSVTAIEVSATASRGKISRLIAEQFTAGATQCILISGALTEFEITDCTIRGNYSTGNISVTAAALHLNIGRNNLVNLNTNVCIICGAVAASGIIYNNYCVLTGATAAPFAAAITLGSAIWVLFQNYAVDAAALTGALIGTAAT